MSWSRRFLPVTLLYLLLLAPFTYSWRVDYSCYACDNTRYYVSGVDEVQFIFSQVGPLTLGFDIWLSQGQSNASTHRVAVLGEDVPPTTYRTLVPANISSNNNYYYNIQRNTSNTGLTLGPFRIQAPESTDSSSTVSSTSSPTDSPTGSSTGSPTGSPTESSTNTPDDNDKSDTGTIVGAVVGTVGGVALIIGAVFFGRRRKEDQAQGSHTAHNNMNNNTYGGSPPPQQQMVYNTPGHELHNIQYGPTPVVASPTSPQHVAPQPNEIFSPKPDILAGQQIQSTSPQPQHQNPHVPDEAPAPPYRFQNPHEQPNQVPHSH